MSKPTEQLAPDLWRIPIPLPPLAGAEHLGFCNAYLIGGEPWILIDTGMTTDEAWTAFESGLAEARVPLKAIESVLITHHHPDHYGMSRPIRDRSGARVMMHQRDADLMKGRETAGPAITAFFLQHGGPKIEGRPPIIDAKEFQPAEADAYLEDDYVFELGDRRMRVLHTPGHSPGHCCFALGEEGIILTGDHILPKITPHVGYFPNGDPNPLASFLDSLRRVGEGSYRLALPAHGDPFLDPASHVARIVAHHEYRLKATVDALGKDAWTGWDLVPEVFGELPDVHRFAAFFELLSHLVLAASEGSIVEEDDGGVTRWRRA